MILKGYCDKLNKEYVINVDTVDAGDLEDKSKIEITRIRCEFIKSGGKCNGAKCSILEQNGIKR